MTITPLSYEEQIRRGFTHTIVLPYTDFTGLTSGTAYSILPKFNSATTFAAGFRIGDVAWQVTTAFTFSAGTLVFKVGDGGDAARFVAASTDLKTAAYGDGAIAKFPYTYASADTIDITITAGAGTPATIAAGSLTLYVAFYDMSKI